MGLNLYKPIEDQIKEVVGKVQKLNQTLGNILDDLEKLKTKESKFGKCHII